MLWTLKPPNQLYLRWFCCGVSVGVYWAHVYRGPSRGSCVGIIYTHPYRVGGIQKIFSPIYLTFGFCNIFTWKFISRKGIQLGNSSLWLYIHNFTCCSLKNSCCLNLQEIFELGCLLLISEITRSFIVWHSLTTVYNKSRSFAISIHSEWFWGSWKGARVFAQNVLLPVWHFAHLNVVFAPARNFPVWVLSWKTVAISFWGIISHLHGFWLMHGYRS